MVSICYLWNQPQTKHFHFLSPISEFFVLCFYWPKLVIDFIVHIVFRVYQSYLTFGYHDGTERFLPYVFFESVDANSLWHIALYNRIILLIQRAGVISR